jgi:hypothetical protein
LKRDLDLIRDILLAIEAEPHGQRRGPIAIPNRTAEEVGYHCHLLLEAGLARGTATSHLASASPSAMLTGLTWEGHEFLDAAREPTRWDQAKSIVSKLGSVPLEVIKGVLIRLATSSLGG